MLRSASADVDNAKSAAVSIAKGRALQGAFERILEALAFSMGSTVIGVRGKALRGLSSIVVLDPSLLRLVSVDGFALRFPPHGMLAGISTPGH